MRRIKILCAILLIFFFASLYQGAVLPFFEGVKAGMTSAKYQLDHHEKMYDFVLLDVVPKDYSFFENSEVNQNTNETVLVRPNNLTITLKSLPAKSTVWFSYRIINFVLTCITLILGIWVPFLLVKIVRSLQKSEVFERRNLKRINRIGIILMAVGILGTLLHAANIYSAQVMVDLSHYDFSYSNVVDFNPIIMGIVILIMNEILRFSIEIKEEQDLTI